MGGGEKGAGQPFLSRKRLVGEKAAHLGISDSYSITAKKRAEESEGKEIRVKRSFSLTIYAEFKEGRGTVY